MWPKRKSLTSAIRTIPPPIPLHQSKIHEIVRVENQKSVWHSGRVQDKISRGSLVQSPVWPKVNLSQDQSEQYHHQSLCTRVKYLKLSELKTRSDCGTVVECRTRDPEGLGSNCAVAKKDNLAQDQSEQYHHQSLCTRVKYLNLSEVKTRSCHGTVVECRTRYPEVLGSNPSVAKKKISQQSNQNNTTTNPYEPQLNTWNCQRWNQKLTWCSDRVRD